MFGALYMYISGRGVKNCSSNTQRQVWINLLRGAESLHIRHLVPESFVPLTQSTSISYWRLSDFTSVQQSRQQAIRANCLYVYTVISQVGGGVKNCSSNTQRQVWINLFRRAEALHIRHLVPESFVPSTQSTSILYWRLLDFKSVQQSRQQAIKVYCLVVYTVI